MKRRIALLLALVMLLAVVPVQAADGAFYDVAESGWAYSSIKTAAQAGLIRGIEENCFGYGQGMSRAAYVTALNRLMGWTAVTPEKGSFADNQNPKKWYFSAIETAYANGVLTKQSAYCRPTEAITREEMAVMTVRALGYAGLSGLVQESCPFPDVSANQGYITLAYRMGLITGTNYHAFTPKRMLRREEAAVVLVRVLEQMKLNVAQSDQTAPADAVRAKSITAKGGTLPMSPRAPLETVYAAAVKANGSSVVLHTTPLEQIVKNGKVEEEREIPKSEVVTLIKNGTKVYRSTRYESSYLLYKENGKTHVVWYESDTDLAKKTSLCALLGVKTVYIER